MQTADLSFDTPGIVTEIAVQEGQHVAAGDILVRQDDQGYQLAVQQAHAGLQAAQLTLQQVQAPPSADQLATAQANLTAAKDTYNALLSAIDPSAIAAAQLKLQQAQTAYQDAVQHRRDVGGQYPASSTVYQTALAQEGEASFAVEAAQLQLQELQRGVDSRIINAAKARIALAQAQIDQLRAGPPQAQIDQATLAVQQAQTALDQAQKQLEAASLHAPFAGIISQVSARVGALSGSAIPAITLIDDSHLHVTIAVDEVDVGQVRQGQPVALAFDPLPDAARSGHISPIARTPHPSGGPNPIAAQSSGVVTYAVDVTLDPSSVPIKIGMTASAAITVRSETNVLRIPNAYIRLDRTTNTAYVNRVNPNGTLTEIPVQLGLRTEDYSEVVGGLSEGDLIGINLDSSFSILGN